MSHGRNRNDNIFQRSIILNHIQREITMVQGVIEELARQRQNKVSEDYVSQLTELKKKEELQEKLKKAKEKTEPSVTTYELIQPTPNQLKEWVIPVPDQDKNEESTFDTAIIKIAESSRQSAEQYETLISQCKQFKNDLDAFATLIRSQITDYVRDAPLVHTDVLSLLAADTQETSAPSSLNVAQKTINTHSLSTVATFIAKANERQEIINKIFTQIAEKKAQLLALLGKIENALEDVSKEENAYAIIYNDGSG